MPENTTNVTRKDGIHTEAATVCTGRREPCTCSSPGPHYNSSGETTNFACTVNIRISHSSTLSLDMVLVLRRALRTGDSS